MAANGPRRNAGQQTSGVSGRGTGSDRKLSQAVYRRRRMVLALLVLAVLGAVVWAGVVVAATLSGGKDAPASEPFRTAPESSPGPAADAEGKTSSTPEASGEATPPEEGMCPPSAVRVEATTDAAAYAAGSNPLLTLSVTNTGAEPCRINVGTTQMEFVVTSGSDRIFSSADCQDGAEDLLKEFEPGATEKANFTWDRLRSAPGCAAVASNPNPGWYVYTARLGEATSEKAVFQLD
ncbi:hypothetical protein ITX31_11230 [Arthrobacter gandavensis]|uniref:hypothetical protein n=1 Tax=Arthrobacter gandavensis TaxID=169960 RepID=UPI0018906E9F|nr:hypothetical protein [Arthrobacter gandavensis]MBF4994683.1 hypothetical protein [Arthrobacter gandavensis]